MACGDPSPGQEESAPCKSPARQLICRQEQLTCEPWNGADVLRDLLLGKGRAPLRIQASTGRGFWRLAGEPPCESGLQLILL